MRVRWENVFGLMLLIFSIYLFIKMGPFLKNLFEDLNGGYYHHDDPLLRVLMLGLLCLTVLAALTIISNRRKQFKQTQGPASLKEARKEIGIMQSDYDYRVIGSESQQVPANPIVNLPQRQRNSSPNDLEVIDLDDPRGQIKPTTWHR